MTAQSISLAQGETRVCIFDVALATGGAAPLDGITLHAVVRDSAGNLIASLCKKTGAGIVNDVTTGEADVTWNRDDSVNVAVGTYSWSLWSEDPAQSPGEWQETIEWSPFYVTPGVPVFP